MPQFALANHVFVCVQGEHVVFLDVRKDRYFALDAQKTAGLAALVPGWPVRKGSDALEDASATATAGGEGGEDSPTLQLLLQRGLLLLADGSMNGKAATPMHVIAPSCEITADDYDDSCDSEGGEGVSRSPRRTADIVAFVRSAALASLMLKMRSFESVLRRVARRRETLAAENASGLDTAQARKLVASFTSLRPFFFSGKDECLFEALALSEFLARFELFPSWVFGVQARPFAAHCWLQQGGCVLNDTVEHVSRYTPIMCI